MLGEKRRLQYDVEKNKNYAISYIIMNICTGKLIPSDLENKEIAFQHGLFCVIIVDYEDSINLKPLLSRYINIFYPDCKAYNFIDNNGRLCIVLNIPSCYDKKLIIQKVRHAKGVISNHFGFMLYIGVGSIYESVDKLAESYKEAKKSIEYCLLKENNTMVLFSEMENPDMTSFNLLVNSGKLLLNSIKIGDVKTCLSLLDESFEGVLKNENNISIYNIYCLFYNSASVI